MRKSLLLAALLMAGVMAYAAPGDDCRSAIPMGKNYSAEVKKGQTVWYWASTFDLPLSVYFAPANGEADPAPEVAMDFSCTTGYYTDSILCSLFCKTSGGTGLQFDMPHIPTLKSDYLDDTFVYYLSLGKQYRDLLLQVGISYNVKVFVKVTYLSDGQITLTPDNLFTNCVDGAKFMRIGDTVQVAAQDKERHVIVPYLQWQEDTIIYKWTGTTPCTLSVANECDFDPLVATDVVITTNEIAPGDSVKYTADLLYDYVHNPEYPNEAGMYFAKIYSEEPGVLKVVKAPQTPPEGEAIMLRLDKTYALDANSKQVFAIPRSWVKDVQFTTPTNHLFYMTLAPNPDFAADEIIRTYKFDIAKEGHWMGVFGADLTDYWKKVPVEEEYMYIRFTCTESTTITPSEWVVSECSIDKSTKKSRPLISPDTTFTVARNSAVIYRFYYPEWKDGEITATFSKTDACKLFIAVDCTISNTSTTAPNLLIYKVAQNKNTVTIPVEDVNAWADRIAEDGYFYARFHTGVNGGGQLTLTSSAPRDADPVYPHTSIVVECDNDKNVFVRVSEDQTLVVTDVTDTKMDEWEAVVGDKHPLNLQPGTYTISGKNDKIVVNL